MSDTSVDIFDSIEYLSKGNSRQQAAYQLLTKYHFMELLINFSPILAGTIPINIDIANSDLDIICNYTDKESFRAVLIEHFSAFRNFSIEDLLINNTQAILASFNADGWPIEIFGQNIPVKQQMAYRHMLIEHKILKQKGDVFRKQIIDLKNQGYKTEPAFARALGLSGDPYIGLLDMEV